MNEDKLNELRLINSNQMKFLITVYEMNALDHYISLSSSYLTYDPFNQRIYLSNIFLLEKIRNLSSSQLTLLVISISHIPTGEEREKTIECITHHYSFRIIRYSSK